MKAKKAISGFETAGNIFFFFQHIRGLSLSKMISKAK